jgi:endonuclease-3
MHQPDAPARSDDRSQGPGDRLKHSLTVLSRRYPPRPPITDPLELIIWENIGYLISDERRQILFDELAETIGLDATRLAAAPHQVLFGIAERGGMRPAERSDRLRLIGRLALEVGGDLALALRCSSPAQARALLKRFPGIADPGADKILLFSGIDIRPALESNGVRAMARLGHAVEGASYAQAYRSATTALRGLGPPDRGRLVEAFLVLRAHGQALCKRAAPECLPCPLDGVCPKIVTRL